MGPIDFCSLQGWNSGAQWFDFRKLLANQNKKWQKKCWQFSGLVTFGSVFMCLCEKSFRAVAVTSHWWIHPVHLEEGWRRSLLGPHDTHEAHSSLNFYTSLYMPCCKDCDFAMFFPLLGMTSLCPHGQILLIPQDAVPTSPHQQPLFYLS